MAQQVFKVVQLRKRSLLQRIFKQYPEENAVIEVNNLLASTPIELITLEAIRAIEQRNNVNLIEEFKLNLEEFYAVLLNRFLQNEKITHEEKKVLKHLEYILSLDQKTVDNLHEKIGEQVYRRAFQQRIKDGHLSEDNKEFLNKLALDARLPKIAAKKISDQESQNFLNQYVEKILSSRKYSPSIETNLKEMSQSLGIRLLLSNEVNEKLSKLKLYWELENLPLPVIQADIAIQNSEVCYLRLSNVGWCETRAVRIGSGQSSQVMKLIDTGTVYLTNKRLMFVGREKHINIRFEKILSTTARPDGILLEKETGKSPVLKFASKADVFHIILKRAMKDF